MFSSFAFLCAALSFPLIFAVSAKRSLSIKIHGKEGLLSNSFLLPETASAYILETNIASIGRGREVVTDHLLLHSQCETCSMRTGYLVYRFDG